MPAFPNFTYNNTSFTEELDILRSDNPLLLQYQSKDNNLLSKLRKIANGSDTLQIKEYLMQILQDIFRNTISNQHDAVGDNVLDVIYTLIHDIQYVSKYIPYNSPKDSQAYHIPIGGYQLTYNFNIGTSEVHNCLCIFVHNPTDKKIGLIHCNRNIQFDTIMQFLKEACSCEKNNKLEVRIIGARYHNDHLSEANLSKVQQALKQFPNIQVLSVDIYSNSSPSNVCV